MTNEQAVKFIQSGWWMDKTAEQITALQLYEAKVCLPNQSYLHKAVEAALRRSTFPREFTCREKLQEEFEKKCPNADSLKAEMSALKATFCYDLYAEQVDQLYIGDTHISPDFQCDQMEGFPASLCVNWDKGKAWLRPNEFLLMDWGKIEQNYCRQLCADFGIRVCNDAEQFNSILHSLGEDAIHNAELPTEEEGPDMRW